MADKAVNVNDFQVLAEQVLPKMYYDFYAGGAEDEHTLKENVEAFRRITFRPRVLVDVSTISMSTTILGHTISTPIMIAPTSMHKLAHPQGEIATARAAAACNTIMVVSMSSSCSLEEVAASCNAVRFFQLYVYKRRDIAAKLVERAESNDYKAIVLTVDAPRLGRREAYIRHRYTGLMVVPQRKNLEGLFSIDAASEKDSKVDAYANAAFDASFSWKDIAWLKSITSLPILLKGILTREDAMKSMEVGVGGIIVSNHGARQLDCTPATISVLEEVVDAVGGKVPVLLDGGVRRGTDVLKALALGAKAILVGRPVLYGLAVTKVIEMLKNELEIAMALSGCPTLGHITRNHIRTPHDKFHPVS